MHTALAEDIDPAPRSHIGQLTAACNSSSRGSDSPGHYGYLHAHVHTNKKTHTHIQTLIIHTLN